MLYAIIPAGGSGTRLWPLSRSSHPKHLLNLTGEGSLIQITVNRIKPLIPPERILIVTEQSHAAALHQQLPEIPAHNIIVEPARRDTAAVIGLGLLHARKRDPEAVVAALHADHIIHNEKHFRTILAAAATFAEQSDNIVTIGIQPTCPHTGFGYIKSGDQSTSSDGITAFKVEQFTEKPDLPTAKAFITTGTYFWNAGMFIAKASILAQAYQKYLPEHYQMLEQIGATIDTDRETQTLASLYPSLAKIPIDTGIMEKATNILVIPADIGWSDIGSWAVVKEVIPPNQGANLVLGEHLGIDTSGCIIYSQGSRLIATIGLRNMAIIDSGDAILICPLERAQQVKSMTGLLKDQLKDTYL
jgi:mannose-1-phosphate guanylyltransferase